MLNALFRKIVQKQEERQSWALSHFSVKFKKNFISLKRNLANNPFLLPLDLSKMENRFPFSNYSAGGSNLAAAFIETEEGPQWSVVVLQPVKPPRPGKKPKKTSLFCSCSLCDHSSRSLKLFDVCDVSRQFKINAKYMLPYPSPPQAFSPGEIVLALFQNQPDDWTSVFYKAKVDIDHGVSFFCRTPLSLPHFTRFIRSYESVSRKATHSRLNSTLFQEVSF